MHSLLAAIHTLGVGHSPPPGSRLSSLQTRRAPRTASHEPLPCCVRSSEQLFCETTVAAEASPALGITSDAADGGADVEDVDSVDGMGAETVGGGAPGNKREREAYMVK
eukprot:6765123-Prymnesium_polylepis.1